ncbi:MAG: hypothetical protein ABII00_05525 [Elusimicrobiota bacterium]
MKTRLLWDIPASAIVLPLQSKNMFDAMDELVPRALHDSGKIFQNCDHIAKTIREALQSGFAEHFDRVAIIKQSVAGLKETRLAIGIAPDGIASTRQSQIPPFVLLLCLLAEDSLSHHISSYERRKFCDERTVYKLRTALDAKSVLRALKEGPA